MRAVLDELCETLVAALFPGRRDKKNPSFSALDSNVAEKQFCLPNMMLVF